MWPLEARPFLFPRRPRDTWLRAGESSLVHMPISNSCVWQPGLDPYCITCRPWCSTLESRAFGAGRSATLLISTRTGSRRLGLLGLAVCPKGKGASLTALVARRLFLDVPFRASPKGSSRPALSAVRGSGKFSSAERPRQFRTRRRNIIHAAEEGTCNEVQKRTRQRVV